MLIRKISTLFFLLTGAFQFSSAQFNSVTGHASYYAKSFEGQETASGETYSNYDMTCANRSLPFGTYLKVTNLKNDMSTIVRVNDRGPYAAKRIIDLTEQAARIIGLYHHGITSVRIEQLDLIHLTPELKKIFAPGKIIDCTGQRGELEHYSLSVWRTKDLVHALYVANDIYLKEDIPRVFITAKGNAAAPTYHIVITGLKTKKAVLKQKKLWESRGFMKVILLK